MYGGFGEDVLFGDSGDTLFGGGQDDKFQIVVTDTANPAVIEDYQAGEEFALETLTAVSISPSGSHRR